MRRIWMGIVLWACIWGRASFAAAEGEPYKEVDLADMQGRITHLETSEELREFTLKHLKKWMKGGVRYVDTDVKIHDDAFRLKFSYVINKGEIKILGKESGTEVGVEIQPIKGNTQEVLLFYMGDAFLNQVYALWNLNTYRYKDYLEGCNVEGLLVRGAWTDFSPDHSKAVIQYYEQEEGQRGEFYQSTNDFGEWMEPIKKVSLLDVAKKECVALEDLFPEYNLEFGHWVDDDHIFLNERSKEGGALETYQDGYVYDVAAKTLYRVFACEKRNYYDYQEGQEFVYNLYKDGAYRYGFFVDKECNTYVLDKLTGEKNLVPSLKWKFGMEAAVNEDETRACVGVMRTVEEGVLNEAVDGNVQWVTEPLYLLDLYKREVATLKGRDLYSMGQVGRTRERLGEIEANMAWYGSGDLVLNQEGLGDDVLVWSNLIRFQERKVKKARKDKKIVGKVVGLASKKANDVPRLEKAAGEGEEMREPAGLGQTEVAGERGDVPLERREDKKPPSYGWALGAGFAIALFLALLFWRNRLDNDKNSK